MMKMAIYTYELTRASEREIFQQPEVSTDHAQAYLDKLLEADELPLRATSKKTGKLVVHPNIILARRGGVVLMRVCNVKHVTVVRSYQERQEESHPYCHVLIDNRPGVAQIAVEQTKAFDKKPDKVRRLLQDALQTLLAEVGLTITIRAKMHDNDFWETVAHLLRNKGEQVNLVAFEFSGTDKSAPIDTPPTLLEQLCFLQSLSAALAAARLQYKLEASRTGTQRLDRTREDLSQLVRLCCNIGYQISVRFKGLGVFRYGEQARDLDEEILSAFLNGQQSLPETDTQEACYALTGWLDSVREQTKKLDNEKTPEGKGKQRHRRAIQ